MSEKLQTLKWGRKTNNTEKDFTFRFSEKFKHKRPFAKTNLAALEGINRIKRIN